MRRSWPVDRCRSGGGVRPQRTSGASVIGATAGALQYGRKQFKPWTATSLRHLGEGGIACGAHR
ncbi:MAG: hypothetical protein AVDCRST_MAG29-2171 [uncultured Nocardioidaceae bacterium]|uniref:Uncharacterized protein n=1 Tax=uncultured Nocardioidaceae bacterium TaxID=253824 RepID=A0A6J4M4X4_9ACTN|nr:MAG: hypothetical protein AVDCRST_MAG29-2171 [uncultured Nocardioidaceae bacterium]